jgi:20S proteasome subunit alpha 6
VLVGLKRSQSELASFQQKVFKIDENIGIGVAGILPDGRVLMKYMRDECLNHQYVYNAPMVTERLVVQVSDKAQRYTQTTEKRPYGVGLLVAGYDKTGPHIFETIPTGAYLEYEGQAIGTRFQAAKTYLQNEYKNFPGMDSKTLIMAGLNALKGSSQKNLTTENVVVGIVGKNEPFITIEGLELADYIDGLDQEDENANANEDNEDREDDDEAMEIGQ